MTDEKMLEHKKYYESERASMRQNNTFSKWEHGKNYKEQWTTFFLGQKKVSITVRPGYPGAWPPGFTVPKFPKYLYSIIVYKNNIPIIDETNEASNITDAKSRAIKRVIELSKNDWGSD